MKYLTKEDLINLLPTEWGCRREEDINGLIRAINLDPSRMRRIHDLSKLMFDQPDRRTWAHRPLENDADAIDLFCLGIDGIIYVDAHLMETFAKVCPRAVFPLAGQVMDQEGETKVISRIVWDRVRSGMDEDTPLHDVTALDCRSIADPSGKIAKSILAVLAEYDGQGARSLIVNAAMDPCSQVRIAAMRVAQNFLGYQDVAGAVAAGRDDLDDEVVLESVRTLAKRVKFKDVAELVTDFTSHVDPRVRLEAVRALSEATLDDSHRLGIIGLAFDPVDDVKHAARRMFTPIEIENYVRRLRREAETGANLRPFEINVAISDEAGNIAGDGDDLEKLIIERIVALTAEGKKKELAETFRFLNKRVDQISDNVWKAVDAVVSRDPCYAYEAALYYTLPHCQSEVAWRIARTFLETTPEREGMSVRVGFAEAMIGAALNDVRKIREMIALYRDTRIDSYCRVTVFWALSQSYAGPDMVTGAIAVVRDYQSPSHIAGLAMDWLADHLEEASLRKLAMQVKAMSRPDDVTSKAEKILERIGGYSAMKTKHSKRPLGS